MARSGYADTWADSLEARLALRELRETCNRLPAHRWQERERAEQEIFRLCVAASGNEYAGVEASGPWYSSPC